MQQMVKSKLKTSMFDKGTDVCLFLPHAFSFPHLFCMLVQVKIINIYIL